MSLKAIHRFLKDKTVVIIGATGGLGEVFAKQCRLHTDRLVLIGRNYQKLQTLSKKLKCKFFFQLDITEYEKIDSVIDEIEKSVGKIEIFINLIGYDVLNNISDLSLEEITATNRINFEGPIILTQSILKRYIIRQRGIIANVNAFSNGLVPFPFYSVDSASRAGIASFYRSMRREISTLYPLIRFVTFSPPITDTTQERLRISARVWEKFNIEFRDPEEVVGYILNKIAKGKNEIIFRDERALLFAEKISRRLSNIFYFKKLITIVKNVLSNKPSKNINCP